MEARRALDSGVPVKPLMVRTLLRLPVPIESGRLRPTQNVDEPEIEVIVGKPPPALLHASMASAARPPQPVPILMSARPVCQAWIWSECENRA